MISIKRSRGFMIFSMVVMLVFVSGCAKKTVLKEDSVSKEPLVAASEPVVKAPEKSTLQDDEAERKRAEQEQAARKQAERGRAARESAFNAQAEKDLEGALEGRSEPLPAPFVGAHHDVIGAVEPTLEPLARRLGLRALKREQRPLEVRAHLADRVGKGHESFVHRPEVAQPHGPLDPLKFLGSGAAGVFGGVSDGRGERPVDAERGGHQVHDGESLRADRARAVGDPCLVGAQGGAGRQEDRAGIRGSGGQTEHLTSTSAWQTRRRPGRAWAPAAPLRAGARTPR